MHPGFHWKSDAKENRLAPPVDFVFINDWVGWSRAVRLKVWCVSDGLEKRNYNSEEKMTKMGSAEKTTNTYISFT